MVETISVKTRWQNKRTGRTYWVMAVHATDGGWVQLAHEWENYCHWLTARGFLRDYKPLQDA